MRSIHTRLEQLEQGSFSDTNVYVPNAEGVIPDEFRPDKDTLILYRIISVDGTKRPYHPQLFWRGQPFWTGEHG